jgi:hypothetical protein
VCVHLLTLGYEAYHLGVREIRLHRPDSDLSDHSVAVDVLLRREPDEEEDEDEDEHDGGGNENEDDDDEGESDDGYSE